MVIAAVAAALPSLLGTAAGIGIGIGVSTAANPLLNVANQQLNKILPITKADPTSMIDQKFRGILDDATFQDYMRTYGINEEITGNMLEGQRVILGIQENINLFRRGLSGMTKTEQETFDKLGQVEQNAFTKGRSTENEQAYFSNMESLGIEQKIAVRFITAAQVIATPQQLVLFLVREVLDPEKRKLLQLDADFPEAAIVEFAKVGINRELALAIWAAHWALPSIQQLQLDFWRYKPADRKFWEPEIVEQGLDPDQVETSKEDIQDLLKFQDVGTFYREQVLATLFNDLGQIQLRWLIRFRFLDFDTAVYKHERQGLPRTIAEQVTKVVFVVQSITDWRTAIKAGSMTFDDVLNELSEWHITETKIREIIKLKVAPEQLDGVADERKLSKSLLFKAFDLKELTRTELISGLEGLGFSNDQASFMFEVHEADKELGKLSTGRERGLTKADIKNRFKEGLDSKQEAIENLVEIGINRSAAEEIIELEVLRLGK